MKHISSALALLFLGAGLNSSPVQSRTPRGFIEYHQEVLRPASTPGLPPIRNLGVLSFQGDALGDSASNLLWEILNSEPVGFRLLDRRCSSLAKLAAVPPGTLAADSVMGISLGNKAGSEPGADVLIGGSVFFHRTTKEGSGNCSPGMEGPRSDSTAGPSRTGMSLSVTLFDVDSGRRPANFSWPEDSLDTSLSSGEAVAGAGGSQNQLSRALRGYVVRFAPHREVVQLLFHQEAGRDGAEAIVRALREGHDDEALSFANSRVAALGAPGSDHVKRAAALQNRSAVLELRGDFEGAYRCILEAVKNLRARKLEIPPTYRNSARRLRNLIES